MQQRAGLCPNAHRFPLGPLVRWRSEPWRDPPVFTTFTFTNMTPALCLSRLKLMSSLGGFAQLVKLKTTAASRNVFHISLEVWGAPTRFSKRAARRFSASEGSSSARCASFPGPARNCARGVRSISPAPRAAARQGLREAARSVNTGSAACSRPSFFLQRRCPTACGTADRRKDLDRLAEQRQRILMLPGLPPPARQANHFRAVRELGLVRR